MNRYTRQVGTGLVAAALSMILSVSFVNGAWVNVTGNLAGHASACGNVFAIFAVPTQNKIIVSVCGNQGLFATTNNGTSWQAMGSSTGWVDPQSVLFDKENPNVFWESGIHGGQIHKTTDGGATFTIVNGATNGDGIGVDMTDPQRKTIVEGAHEGSNLTVTKDGGATWTNITAGTSGWTNFPIVVDAQTYILGSGNGGIFRTTNSGAAWTKVSALTPGWNPLITSKGDYYFTANGNQAILRSTDKGLTWTSMAKPGDGPGWYTPIEMPDGSIAAIGQGKIVQCSNGTTWTTLVGSLPPATGNLGVAYNSVSGAFFISLLDCNATVPATGLWKYDYATSIRHDGNKRQSNLYPAAQRSSMVIIGTQHSSAKSGSVFDLYGRKLNPNVKIDLGIGFEQAR
jgi:photosystem II stability/assembly factor-like uncharacterized protein